MRDELLEAWHTNNRINLHLIDHISEAGMGCTLSRRGGRSVAGQFAHMHNMRLWHLEKRAPDLTEGLTPFESKVSPDKERLRTALLASGDAVAILLSDVLAGRPQRRGFKKGIFTTLSYFVAHESHHRGSILLTLKQSGHQPEKKVRYAIWAWDRI